MTRRSRAAAVTLAVVGALLLAAHAVGFTTAAFTSSSSSRVSIAAAADWTPPTVVMGSPGSPVKGTVTLGATASDADSGLASVAIQYQLVGGSTWTTVCTLTASPWSCPWATGSVTDGQYDLRAVATDNAGYTAISDSVRTTVANNLLVVLADPGDVVKGSVPLSATLYNAGSTTYKVNIEYALTGTTTWKSVTGCTNLASPYGCTWATTGVANDAYDLRAVATAGSTTTVSATVVDVLVDNLAPTVTMNDPGSPLAGTRTLSTTAADAGSGLAQVLVQVQLSGSATWTTVCTIVVSPWSCSFDTTKVVDGTYAFRAVATDVAGNTTTSASVTGRVIDNTVSSVSMNDPGAWVSGTTTVSAVANSTAGVTSVRIDVAPRGTTTWTALCTATVSPYSCSWNTTTLADGSYDLRAVLTDGTSKVTTSALVTTQVDNSPLRAYDVQAVNGTGTPGKLDAGDTLSYTWTEAANLGSITPGWTGASIPVTVRLRDGGLVGLSTKGDTVDVQRAGSAVNLGGVVLNQDFVKGGKTVTFNATMVAGTVTVNGVTATRVTVTLGTLASGTGLRTVTATGTMTWNPSTGVLDANGRAAATTPASERGTLDRDF